LDDVRQHRASPAKMAPNGHEFHESDQKFLAPGAATPSNRWKRACCWLCSRPGTRKGR